MQVASKSITRNASYGCDFRNGYVWPGWGAVCWLAFKDAFLDGLDGRPTCPALPSARFRDACSEKSAGYVTVGEARHYNGCEDKSEAVYRIKVYNQVPEPDGY